MPCKCKKIVEETEVSDIAPDDSCLICAQKHILAAHRALHEFGHADSESNHNYAIGELKLGGDHVQEDFPELAQKIRDIRHFVQYWQYDKIGGKWEEVFRILNAEIRKELGIKAPPSVLSVSSVPSVLSSPRKIYIFSNVKYPSKNKIDAKPGDILVFLNKADSVGYYADVRCMKFVFHRSPNPEYGKPVPHCLNQYVFGEGAEGNIPKKFIEELKKSYDWNYEIEEEEDKEGNVKKVVKSMTTGYMVVKWIQQKYPNCEIILVNFGYEVKNSTYRCPWHNWKFEAKELQQFKHIYTAETKERMEIVYCTDQTYLDRVKMSAETVLKHNPDAHITVVSAEPLQTEYDNVVVDTSKYNFRSQESGHLSNAAYLKLLLPQYLDYNKIIYLDGDTICRGPLDDLYHTAVEYIGLCHSYDAGIVQAGQIGVEQYGLSGAMLMDLAALREIEFSKIAMYAMEHFKFPKTQWYCDETVLNCCFNDRFTFLDIKWNFCVNRNYTKYSDQVTAESAVILHFPGGQKDEQQEYYQREMANNALSVQ